MAVTPPSIITFSHTALYARRFIKYGAIMLMVFMVGRVLLNSAVSLYKALNPPPPAPPTLGFGAIPAPLFPTQFPEDRPATYKLETVGNRFPNFGPTTAVYFMPIAQPGLLALDKAKETASALGFVFQPERMETELYRWRRTDPIPATFEMDIVHRTSILKVDWSTAIGLLEKKMIPTPSQLTSEIRTLLRGADMLADDVATSTPQLTYVKALGGETRVANSISDADFVQADLFRTTPDGRRGVTAFPNKGVIQILFSGSREQGERILHLESNYYPVIWTQAETYPLRPAQEAWQALQAGEGFVISKGAVDAAVVRTVELAYYEPATPQNFYQPVYLFTGDNGFQAMVPALAAISYQAVP